MKKSRMCLLLILIALFTMGISNAHAITKMEQRFLDSFPSSISDWERQSSYNYEKEAPGGGVSISYGLNDAVATLYIYNMNLKTIPSGISSKVIKGEFSESKAAIITAKLQGYYQDVVKKNEGKAKFGLDKKMSFLFANYYITQNDIDLDSYLYITAIKNHYFKIRVTSTKGTLTEENLKPFLDSATDLVFLL